MSSLANASGNFVYLSGFLNLKISHGLIVGPRPVNYDVHILGFNLNLMI